MFSKHSTERILICSTNKTIVINFFYLIPLLELSQVIFQLIIIIALKISSKKCILYIILNNFALFMMPHIHGMFLMYCYFNMHNIIYSIYLLVIFVFISQLKPSFLLVLVHLVPFFSIFLKIPYN